ncbi:hypothetical protein I553_5458 [Mycobacterium xenopi 4042]|uniref:Uncharacterized protein n=1 Tax=Mycobacterium xenopi 4042 TaxID=1299334 RepID=X7ZTY9_MYCXE|nr:hypothetical protein I553_5458 [Mycobacterium xenopi 4042]
MTRHGCEPWEDLAVKLMLKWPNLYYSTSAFAPRYYPKRSSTTPTRAARTKCSMPGISRWDYRWSESSPKCPTSLPRRGVAKVSVRQRRTHSRRR